MPSRIKHVHEVKVKLKNNDLIIGGVTIKPGEETSFDLPVTRLYTHTPVAIPVHVIRGKKPGPILFVSAAIHGDELNGVEIIRRLLTQSSLKRLHGTLIAIPIVNVHGFINHSRYLPDRRDLNRSFPGTQKGSLAARLASLFMKEIVRQCTHGIDLHTGAIHRDNLPQIRANLDHEETAFLAESFGVPVLLDSDLRDGSLREAAAQQGIPMLLYEAGEALRFDEVSIRAGVRGVTNVMRTLKMLPGSAKSRKSRIEPVVARSSTWARASSSGIMRNSVKLGERITKGQLLAVIADPFGQTEKAIQAEHNGIVIGKTNLPLVNEGDALFHIARFGKVSLVEESLGEFHELHEPGSLPPV